MRGPTIVERMLTARIKFRRFALMQIVPRSFCYFILWATAITANSVARAHAASCADREYSGAQFVVCEAPARAEIRLFLNDDAGEPYAHFSRLTDALANNGETLVFAMNGGMYHRDLSPVGLYVEDFERRAALSTSAGPGNFHLMPNGVFWIWLEDGMRGAHVRSAEIFKDSAQDVVRYATQSGPMLVIDGEIHPRFIPGSDSRKRRNGVGVAKDGSVIFALADTPINFYEFALFFRDVLGTPNALYLDGTISRLYAPELERNDRGAAMGPIIAVVEDDENSYDQ